MIFVNSPFAILDEAFRSLYPDKKYKACIEPSIKDDEGNRVFGFTQFSKGETPVIAISAELNIMDATEIFAHELAHVAAGEGEGHGERWDEGFGQKTGCRRKAKMCSCGLSISGSGTIRDYSRR